MEEEGRTGDTREGGAHHVCGGSGGSGADEGHADEDALVAEVEGV